MMMMVGLPAVLLSIALLLVAVCAVQPVARRLALPETVLLAVVGIVLGGAADVLLRSSVTNVFDGAARTLLDFPIDSEAFLLIFLPILVFQGSLMIDVRRLAHEWATVLLLAIVAVVVSTAAIGFALYPFSGMPLVVCLTLGAIVANTDPSAVAAIFGEIGAASRLTRLVEGEALLNDAAAISIFGILLPALTNHAEVSAGPAIVDFVLSFGGALVVGGLLGRLTLWTTTLVGSTPAAEVTLTIALPYVAYIVCDRFGMSGVVATAAAGLVYSAYGPSTLRPQTWRFVQELWEQLVFWAGSLVFVLASMLVPRLLIGMTRWDVVLILIAVAAGLVARTAVVFGMLPVLAATKLSPPVPTPFKATMVWGGLRGAITLALALAVAENSHVNAEVAHFIGIIATGFVLFTLFLNGTTLRHLVIKLKLDQLSPIDQALRHQVLSIGLGEVKERTRRVAGDLGFPAHAMKHVLDKLDRRIAAEQAANTFDTALGDRQRVTLALITIANQERSILLDLFRTRGISRRVMETLLRSAEAMIDGARLEGRFGYVQAVRRRLSPSWRFRFAQFIHHRLHLDAPLMYAMMERFEMLMVAHIVSLSLTRFMRRRVEPTLGTRLADIVSEVLERQQKLLEEAIGTMRLHYQGYTEALESRMLRQVALRLEGEQYDELLSESLISEELHAELFRGVEVRRHRMERRMRFNLKSGIESRIKAIPALNGVPVAVLHDLAMSVAIHFTAPNERILKRDRAVRMVYFVSAGQFETHVDEHDVHFGPGTVLGADDLLRGGKVRTSVRSLRFGHLLAMSAKEFLRLAEEYPVVRENLDRQSRVRMGEAPNQPLLPAPAGAAVALPDYVPPAEIETISHR